MYRYDIVMAVATAVNILGPRIVTFQMQEKLPPQKLRNCDLRMFQNCQVDGQVGYSAKFAVVALMIELSWVAVMILHNLKVFA